MLCPVMAGFMLKIYILQGKDDKRKVIREK